MKRQEGNGVSRGDRFKNVRMAIAATSLLSLALHPTQVAGLASKGASWTRAQISNCDDHATRFDSEMSSIAAFKPGEAPRIGTSWETKSSQYPGRVDIHVSIDPLSASTGDTIGLVAAGKYGKESPGTYEGTGITLNMAPPKVDACATWWMLGPAVGDGEVYEFTITGAWAYRRYCFVASQADTWEIIGRAQATNSKPYCYTPKWKIGWGWIWE